MTTKKVKYFLMMKPQKTAIVLLAFFTFQQVMPQQSFAQPAAPIHPVLLNQSQIEIPQQSGLVEDVVVPTQPRGEIVHIQTAHGSFEAQKKIQSIIEALSKQGFKTLLLEGGSGELHPGSMRFFPSHRNWNAEFTDQLAERGNLTGAELFMIDSSYAPENTRQVQAFGIEDTDAYFQNRKDFQTVLRAREKSQEFLTDLDMQIERFSAAYLNPELKGYLKTAEAFETKRIDLKIWLNSLSGKAKEELKIDLKTPYFQSQWPMLTRYFRLEEAGQKLNVEEFEKEKKAFMREMGLRGINEKQVQSFETVFIQETLKAGQVTPHLYATALNNLGAILTKLPAGFDFKPYENVKRFAQLMIFHAEMRGGPLFDEMSRLNADIENALAKNKEEKILLGHLKDYQLLKRLFSLELPGKSFEEIIQKRGALKPSALAGSFELFNREKRVAAMEFGHLKEMDELYALAISFYEGALRRDQLMAQKALEILRAQKDDKVIVVTGGFHARGIKQFFESKNFSYYLVTPNMTQDVDMSNYYRLMLDGEESIRNSKIENWLATLAPEMRSLTGSSVLNSDVKQVLRNVEPARRSFLDPKVLGVYGISIPARKGRSEVRSDGITVSKEGPKWKITLGDNILETEYQETQMESNLPGFLNALPDFLLKYGIESVRQTRNQELILTATANGSSAELDYYDSPADLKSKLEEVLSTPAKQTAEGPVTLIEYGNPRSEIRQFLTSQEFLSAAIGIIVSVSIYVGYRIATGSSSPRKPLETQLEAIDLKLNQLTGLARERTNMAYIVKSRDAVMSFYKSLSDLRFQFAGIVAKVEDQADGFQTEADIRKILKTFQENLRLKVREMEDPDRHSRLEFDWDLQGSSADSSVHLVFSELSGSYREVISMLDDAIEILTPASRSEVRMSETGDDFDAQAADLNEEYTRLLSEIEQQSAKMKMANWLYSQTEHGQEGYQELLKIKDRGIELSRDFSDYVTKASTFLGFYESRTALLSGQQLDTFQTIVEQLHRIMSPDFNPSNAVHKLMDQIQAIQETKWKVIKYRKMINRIIFFFSLSLPVQLFIVMNTGIIPLWVVAIETLLFYAGYFYSQWLEKNKDAMSFRFMEPAQKLDAVMDISQGLIAYLDSQEDAEELLTALRETLEIANETYGAAKHPAKMTLEKIARYLAVSKDSLTSYIKMNFPNLNIPVKNLFTFLPTVESLDRSEVRANKESNLKRIQKYFDRFSGGLHRFWWVPVVAALFWIGPAYFFTHTWQLIIEHPIQNILFGSGILLLHGIERLLAWLQKTLEDKDPNAAEKAPGNTSEAVRAQTSRAQIPDFENIVREVISYEKKIEENPLKQIYSTGWRAPFQEELLHRGIVLPALALILGGSIPFLVGQTVFFSVPNLLALVLSSWYFAYVHGKQSRRAFMSRFMGGFYMGAAFLWTGNLAPAFLDHMVNNKMFMARLWGRIQGHFFSKKEIRFWLEQNSSSDSTGTTDKFFFTKEKEGVEQLKTQEDVAQLIVHPEKQYERIIGLTGFKTLQTELLLYLYDEFFSKVDTRFLVLKRNPKARILFIVNAQGSAASILYRWVKIIKVFQPEWQNRIDILGLTSEESFRDLTAPKSSALNIRKTDYLYVAKNNEDARGAFTNIFSKETSVLPAARKEVWILGGDQEASEDVTQIAKQEEDLRFGLFPGIVDTKDAMGLPERAYLGLYPPSEMKSLFEWKHSEKKKEILTALSPAEAEVSNKQSQAEEALRFLWQSGRGSYSGVPGEILSFKLVSGYRKSIPAKIQNMPEVLNALRPFLKENYHPNIWMHAIETAAKILTASIEADYKAPQKSQEVLNKISILDDLYEIGLRMAPPYAAMHSRSEARATKTYEPENQVDAFQRVWTVYLKDAGKRAALLAEFIQLKASIRARMESQRTDQDVPMDMTLENMIRLLKNNYGQEALPEQAGSKLRRFQLDAVNGWEALQTVFLTDDKAPEAHSYPLIYDLLILLSIYKENYSREEEKIMTAVGLVIQAISQVKRFPKAAAERDFVAENRAKASRVLAQDSKAKPGINSAAIRFQLNLSNARREALGFDLHQNAELAIPEALSELVKGPEGWKIQEKMETLLKGPLTVEAVLHKFYPALFPPVAILDEDGDLIQTIPIEELQAAKQIVTKSAKSEVRILLLNFFDGIAPLAFADAIPVMPANVLTDESGNIAKILSGIGIKTPAEAYVFTPEFAITEGGLAVARKAFGNVPIVVIAATDVQKEVINRFNLAEQKSGKIPFLIAEKVGDAARHLAGKRAVGVRVLDDSISAVSLKEQLSDVVTVTPKQLHKLIELTGAEAMVEKFKALVAFAQSA